MLRRIWVAAVGLLACNGPAAYPRSAEIAEPGGVHAETVFSPVQRDAQTVTYTNGTARSNVSILPAPFAGLRFGIVPRCELGGSLPIMAYAAGHYLAEVRCAVVTTKEAGFAVAASGSGGVTVGYLQHATWYGRAGLDLSFRWGLITPMIGAYFSRGIEWHHVTLPDSFAYTVGKFVPPDGPVPVSEDLLRTESRLTLPIGLGFLVGHMRSTAAERIDLVFGVVPWWVVRKPNEPTCGGPCLSYDADKGMSFTAGVEWL